MQLLPRTAATCACDPGGRVDGRTAREQEVKASLTQSLEQLLAHGRGELSHQAQRGHHGEQHVVRQDDVEVAQPVEPAEVAQEVEPGDACTGSEHK